MADGRTTSMTRSLMRQPGLALIGFRFIALLAFFPPLVLFSAGMAAQTETASGGLTLAGARITGTREISQDDLLRGLQLRVSQATTLSELRATCHTLKTLMLYHSYECGAEREDEKAWLTLDVPASSTSAEYEDEIIFDNFVWMSRAEILARIKLAVPLFTAHVQINSPLNEPILRVLNQLVAERGIKSRAVRDEFWTERKKNVYKVEGIHVPVVSIAVEGQNAPRTFKQWADGYESNDFSMALLNWRLNSVLEDAYFPRGYLHPVVREPEVIFLGERNGGFPVRIVLHIDSGAQYTFADLRLEGRAKTHAKELDADWTLKAGAPYDVGYARQFYFSVLNNDWARAGKRSTAGVDCLRIDEKKRAVTLTIKVPENDADLTLSPEAKPCSDLLLDSFFPGNFVVAAAQ